MIAATVGLGMRARVRVKSWSAAGVVDHVRVGHLLHLLDVGAGGEHLLAAVERRPPATSRRSRRLDRRRGSASWTSALSAFIGRAVEPDRRDARPRPRRESERRSCGVAVRRRLAGAGAGSPPPPMIRSCHICTPARTSWMVTLTSAVTSLVWPTMCSPVTTRVSLARPALTMLSCRVISLQVARRVSGSLGTASLMAHWPKTPHDLEVALGAAHEQLLVLHGEGHVAVGVDVGRQSLVDERVQDPPAQGVLVRRAAGSWAARWDRSCAQP